MGLGRHFALTKQLDGGSERQIRGRRLFRVRVQLALPIPSEPAAYLFRRASFLSSDFRFLALSNLPGVALSKLAFRQPELAPFVFSQC